MLGYGNKVTALEKWSPMIITVLPTDKGRPEKNIQLCETKAHLELKGV